MKLIAALCVPALLTMGLGVLVASPASAHTPTVSASCSGVHVSGTSYDAGMANRWSVTINGATQSGTFGGSFDQTFPVPQGGTTSTWSAFVEAADGSYHGEGSGSVGPCGALPPPPPPPPPTDVCADLPGAQPTGTACTPPPDVQRAAAQHLGGCAVTFAGVSYGAGDLAYDEQYTDTYVFDSATNAWTLVTDTVPTIANLVFAPWTAQQQVATGCHSAAPQPPALQTRQRNTHLDCADNVRVITIVTTTTPYVYDAPSDTWVTGTPVEHRSTRTKPARPRQCAESTTPVAAHTPQAPQTPHTDVTQVVSLPAATNTPAQSQSVQSQSSASSQIPTAVDSGLASVSPQLAGVSVSARPVGHREPSDLPALALLTGGVLLAGGALRFRRG
jgi:hypothetical protein